MSAGRTQACFFGLLGFAVVAACSSDTQPSAGDDGNVDDDTPRADGGTVDGALPESAPPTSTFDSGLSYQAVDGSDVTGLLCNRDTAVFDLTHMAPASEMGAAFVNAWDAEIGNPVDTNKPPALVLAAKNLLAGPFDVRIGAATVTQGAVVVPPAGSGTGSLTITYNAGVAHQIQAGRTQVPFTLAIGPADARRTITVAAVVVDLTTDDGCSQATGTVELEIPGSNGTVRFGSGTLADVLGAFNTDTNTDGVDDGWTLRFNSSRGSIPTLSLLP